MRRPCKYPIDLIQQTPSVWNDLLEIFSERKLKTVTCLVGGEPAEISLLKKLKENAQDVVNVYGPTETTIWSTSYLIDDVQDKQIIGTPLQGEQAYILDSEQNQIDLAHVIGELYIGGIGLARGYLNQPKLTKEHFLPNPFLNDGSRLYKTGDLVRKLSCGNIEYLGRNDTQVKIRGHRVELIEIEIILGRYKGIKQCVVLQQNEGDTSYLVAFYTGESVFQIATLKEYMSRFVPEYMIPNSYVHLNKFPLTRSGKIDRKLLSVHKSVAVESNFLDDKLGLPETSLTSDVELFIASLWQKVLKTGDKKLTKTSHFLHLGGHSLLFTTIVRSIRKKYGVYLKIKEFLEHLELHDLASYVESKRTQNMTNKHNTTADSRFRAEPQNLFLDFPLTEVQASYLIGREKFWTLGGISTHIYMEFGFEKLDRDVLEKAWNKVIERHSALRLVFHNNQQHILKTVPYYKIDLVQHGQARANMSHQVFDPACYPLFDVKVSNLKAKQYLHISLDAMIADVYSLNIILSDLTSYYQGRYPKGLEVSFRDYALYELSMKSSPAYLKAQAYWRSKLPNMPSAPKLPLCEVVSSVKKVQFSSMSQVISQKTWVALKSQANQKNISPTTILLVLYGIVLSRFSKQQDILLNITLFNRDPVHPDIEQLVGDFTTLELFAFFNQTKSSMLNCFQTKQSELWEDLEHRLFSGTEVARAIKKYHGYPPEYIVAPYVFTSAIGLTSSEKVLLNNTFSGCVYESAQTSQCILDNILREQNGCLKVDWYYVDSLLDSSFITHLFNCYIELIEYISAANWEQAFPEIELCARDTTVIKKANQASIPLQKGNKTLVESCSLASNQIAVIDSNGKYSYADIQTASASIAAHLAFLIEQKEKLVAVLCEKGHLQVIATLGIMKASMAFLPLSMDWPIARLKEILQEGGVQTILISEAGYEMVKASLLSERYNLVRIRTCLESEAKLSTLFNLKQPEPNDLAYVIFTSGSTGKPKGVSISHYSVVNTLQAVNEKFRVTPEDKVLALSELSFDLAIYDIFGMLMSGGVIVFPDQEHVKEPAHWYHLITRYQVTIWNSVPQLMRLFLDYVDINLRDLSTLRLVLLSGDWIPINLPSQIKAHNPDMAVISLGGATEGSIWSIWYEVKSIESEWTSIPYGQAMPNQKVYILNQALSHCPVGVLGDIYLGGLGLALGYWGNEEKTNAHFIEHPSLGRLYKTGDIGLWHADGYIVFQGRYDSQVKRNGYRVELEEIAKKLIINGDLEDASVRLHDNSRLVAYLVSKAFCSHYFEGFDEEKFRLEVHGVRCDLEHTYKLSILQDKKLYQRYKSYRRFARGQLPAANQLLPTRIVSKFSQPKRRLEAVDLPWLFSPLSAMQLSDKVLPKYLYPSAGSTYAIQSYLYLPFEMGDLCAGYYYFHPTLHTFHLVHHNVLGLFPRIEFVNYRSAIEPLYKRQCWFSYLELGHMLFQVTAALDERNISYRLILDEPLDVHDESAYRRMAYLELGEPQAHSNMSCLCKLETSVLYKEGRLFQGGSHSFDLDAQSLMLQTNIEVGQILESAEALIFWEGVGEIQAWIQAGFEVQRLQSHWQELNLGSCALDLEPYHGITYATIGHTVSDGVVYVMALGKMMAGDEVRGETQPTGMGYIDTLKVKLKRCLPGYMLPDDYLLLEEWPLTANGKLDVKALPRPERNTIAEFVAPKTNLEIELCALWQEVLAIDAVGVCDDFFQIGGNSISAIQVVGRMQSIDFNVSVYDIFLHRSIFKLIEHVNKQQHWVDSVYAPYQLIDEDIKRAILSSDRYADYVIEDIYPASYLQMGMILESLKSPNYSAYHEVSIYEMHLAFHEKDFLNCFNKLVFKHPVLRTCFNENIRYGYIAIQLKAINLQDYVNVLPYDLDINDFVVKEKNNAISIDSPGLFRLFIFNIKEHHFTLALSFHHAIADGWSEAALLAEFVRAYQGSPDSSEQDIPVYQLFIEQELEALHQDFYRNFWVSYLEDYRMTQPNLTMSNAAPGDRYNFSLSKIITHASTLEVLKHAKNSSVSPDILFLTAYLLSLSKFLNQKDLVVGLVMNNRLQQAGGEKVFGLHLNTVPLRIEVLKEHYDDIDSFIKKLVKQRTKLEAYKLYPYGKIKSDTKDNADLYTCVFDYTHLHTSDLPYEKVLDSRTNMWESQYQFEETSLPLYLQVSRSTNNFTLVIQSNTSFIQPETGKRLLDYISYYLDCSAKTAKADPAILPSEYQQVLYDWNQTDASYPRHEMAYQLFEAQVEKTPNHSALVFETESVSYRVLNQRSNQLAHFIRTYYENKGQRLEPDTLIALYLQRSVELVVAILGVLKAGGAYVPIEPEHPRERIRYVLADTKVELLLTQEHFGQQLLETVPSNSIDITYIDCEDRFAAYNQGNLKPMNLSEDLIYVMYTSGSTGRPKGVALQHRGIVNQIDWMQKTYPVVRGDMILQKTPYSFDVSVLEILWPICYGATVVMTRPEHHTNSPYLYELMISQNVTMVHFVPSMLTAFIDYLELENYKMPSALRHIICIGEDFPVALAQKAKRLSHCALKLHNLYGPTEASIAVTAYDYKDDHMYIGKPIQNIQVYVLDERYSPVPIGTTGELYLGGVGLARAYLNKPKQTQEHFIENPFALEVSRNKENDRLYKTGDLVRWLPDGNLEYIGRNDAQINIRGLRIECSEIENVLLGYQGIKRCIVLLRQNEERQYLIAYYLSDEAISRSSLKGYLLDILPNYMVPRYFIRLELFPLTKNGKLNRAELPDPDFTLNDLAYVAPCTELEEKLCSIWQQLLKLERVGIKDNFFTLGGDSILSIQLVSMMRREGIECTVKDLFEYGNIERLANEMTKHRDGMPLPILREQSSTVHDFSLLNISDALLAKLQKRYNVEALYRATNLQQGLIYHALAHPEDDAYRVQILLDYYDVLDIELYRKAWEVAIETYPSLRLCFNWEEELIQVITKSAQLDCTEHDLSEVDDKPDAIALIQKQDRKEKFNLEQPGLFRLHIIKQADRHFTILKSEHHSITDGWSETILVQKIQDIYHQLTRGQLPKIIRDTAYYRAQNYIVKHQSKGNAYWRMKVRQIEHPNDINALLSTYTDLEKFQVVAKPCNVSVVLKSEEYKYLKEFAQHVGVTFNALLQFSWHKVVQAYTQDDQTIVGTVVSGRAIPIEGITESVGLYINTLPMIIEWNNTLSVVEQLQSIHLKITELNENAYASLAEVQEGSGRLFHSILVFENYPTQSVSSYAQDTPFVNVQPGIEKADYPLVLVIYAVEHGLKIDLHHDGNNLVRAKAERLLAHLRNIIQQIPGMLREPQYKVTLLDAADYNHMIHDWNQTIGYAPTRKTIIHLFEERVEKSPDDVALVFNKQHLTYRQLDEQSNQLARLIQKQSKPTGLVALYLERSFEMVIAILGVLKAGGAYVPIDTNYPQARINAMLQDSKPSLLLTQARYLENFDHTHCTHMALDDALYGLESKKALKPVEPHALAYVMYTSGTTGKPKGVMVTHQNLAYFVCYQKQYFALNSKSKVLQYASIGFDASISEIFNALTSGAQLMLIDDTIRAEPEMLLDFLLKHKITWATLPPSLLSSLNYQPLPALKTLVVAGESCSQETMLTWARNRRLINAYGPAEGTVCCTMHDYKPGDLNTNIGTPLCHVKLYVLNEQMHPVPVGVIGELYIAGAGVARGYLNQPELTKSKFISNPFATEQDIAEGHTRLYKTGDLVRWLEGGQLEYIGRADSQVNIRGFRVECHEVESVINSHKAVQASTVQLHETESGKQLVAYYTLEPSHQRGQMSWWPSVAEYYIYDDLLYSLMTSHTTRNECYRLAIRHTVKNLTVLDIGAGPDVVLSRICIEEGAEKVYAIEYLESTYNQARKTIQRLQLEDKIHLILGDSREITLPEQCDVCVSEIVGSIGGAEGAAVILEDAKARHIKKKGKFIPERSVTQIAAVALPRELVEKPYIHPVQYAYIQQIYKQVGHPFDLRLCLKGVGPQDLISDTDVFEELTWNMLEAPIQTHHKHSIKLTITHSGEMNGFLVWLNLHLSQDNVIDILSDQHSWLPIYLPVFSEGITVRQGDYIEGAIERCLCRNGLNFDYMVRGVLHCDGQLIPFEYYLPHEQHSLKHNIFYEKIFEVIEHYNAYCPDNLESFLLETLPSYMVPSAFIHLASFPLTAHGKLDRRVLPKPDFTPEEASYIAPRTNLEEKLCVIWQSILGLEKVGIRDDFFSLGGNSILGIQVISKISKENIDCSMVDLLEARCIERLAEVLSVPREKIKVAADTGSSLQQFKPYMIIHNKLKQLPIFIFPPGEGGAESYHANIVKGLPQSKLVLFNNYYHELKKHNGLHAVDGITIEQMANYYIEKLYHVQNTGPYALFGWSLGGVIAFEVARRLIATGREVSNLILIDSFFNMKQTVDKLFPGKAAKFSEPILYNYECGKVYFPDTKVTLFKATHLDASAHLVTEHVLQEIYSYYLYQEKDNGISKVCEADIEVIQISSSHYDWVFNPDVVDEVCRLVKSINTGDYSHNHQYENTLI